MYHIHSHVQYSIPVQVVQKLSLGLQISRENNMFALFEVGGSESKVIDDRTILVDILGKFEMWVNSAL